MLTISRRGRIISLVRRIHTKARAEIDARGLRYSWVAQRLGLSPDRFNHILNGRRPVPEPELDFYRRLAEALSCEASDLHESAAAAA